MDNRDENFIPPFQAQPEPKRKRPVALIVIAFVLALATSGLTAAVYLQMEHAKNLQRQVDELKASAAKMDEEMAADMNMAQPAEYREIPELGVKYRVTDATKDLTYSYSSDKEGKFESVAFTTKELARLTNEKGDHVCAIHAPSGTITRLGKAATQPDSQDSLGVMKKVGDTSFTYTVPDMKCVVDGKDVPEFQKSVDAVKAAFDSLEAM